ncbi:Glutamate racemase [Tepidanaerobacter acetatoxydans Re1]|uniref:Glutamate racemase n=1 Tax=Tepidanaerobacter acetatoxydans (strain DSM 21804 / JCM 16047 / Re1) TaxID=1209989 RepID=F4LTY2_TEPAE|nr:glutamate racemase [Tepidanaerobacter acetatoxydans]AEE92579.1 Glutamate racemase [Tepidanaerobacter acetatoxydans Re1]CCP27533.1 Glutamate racemase [Tepidanaerobacter acetatoxydans Re1]
MDVRNKPIGVFDSGIGGLTVAGEIMKLLPKENIVYFGDTARVPYGPKSSEVVTQFAFEGLRFLLGKDVKLIVIACNTVSATCLDKLCASSPVPVIGVIEPGARAAVAATENQVVGVIGTERTIKSCAYERAIHALNKQIKIHSKACPLFVPLVEEGWLENEAAFYTAKTYLESLKKQGIDTLVLACTHYPLLKLTLGKVMGETVRLVDSAWETAREVQRILIDKNLKRQDNSPAFYQYFVSDNPEKFVQVGENFLKRPINPINVIDPQI